MANATDIHALEFLTDAGLTAPGLTASFKVFVKTTTGNAARRRLFRNAVPRSKHLPAAQTRLPEAIQRLVDLDVAWEKPEQAAEWQKQLDQAQATLKDSEAKPSKQPTK